jgi:hypothetical protein
VLVLPALGGAGLSLAAALRLQRPPAREYFASRFVEGEAGTAAVDDGDAASFVLPSLAILT